CARATRDDAALRAGVVKGPSRGALSLNASGAFSYTPGADYNGPDSFTYRASDGTLFSTATVSLSVTPVNDAPTDILLNNSTVAEHLPAAVTVGTLTQVDADDGMVNPAGPYAFSLLSDG